jgi:ABC-type Fe3+/spermidine/putrescine transport system ATPase subunit
MIRLHGIQHSFGDFSLSISALSADKGEYLVILGPSGCGKSLLLGTIAGIHQPACGRIYLLEQDVTTAPPERRGLGLVFQRQSLFPHLSVTDNIAFGLAVRGATRAQREQRVGELVETLGLSGVLRRPTATLSGGEAQKVAIARALAPGPSVLLLDEPLSLVDHNARLELQAELRRIHRTLDLTTVHVTHNRDEARALGDRCAVMLGGRMVQVGTMDDVLERPRCSFVARFLGLDGSSPPARPGCSEVCLAGTGQCDQADDEADATHGGRGLNVL